MVENTPADMRRVKPKTPEQHARELYRLVHQNLFADFDFNALSPLKKQGWLRLARFVLKLERKK